MHRLSTGMAAVIMIAAAVTPFFVSAQGSYGDDSIPSGCHPITEDERAAIVAMNSTIPANGMFCDKDKALMFGGCDTSPYPYLQKRNDTGRVDSVSGLNSDFACRLMKFITAAEAQGKRIRITSGYRSVERQAELRKKYDAEVAAGKNPAPVAKPGASKHNFGLAADLTYDGVWPNYGLGAGNTPKCIQTLPSCTWAHASYSTFGLRYPMAVEPWHVEPSGTVSGRQQPLPQGGWTGDETTTPYTNNGMPYNPNTWTPSLMSTAGLFSPLATSLLGSSPQIPPMMPTYPSYPSYPTTDYPTYTWPTATNTIYVTPTTGTESTTTIKNTTTSQQAEHDQVLKYLQDQIGNPTSQSTSTSTPVQLNSDIDQTSTSTRTGTSNVTNSIYDTEKPIASTSVMVNPIRVTETFSQNEQTRASIGSTSSSPLASAQTLLISLMTRLRDVLLTIVQMLLNRTPYGSGAQWKPVATSTPYR